jgi:hypothetical protein
MVAEELAQALRARPEGHYARGLLQRPYKWVSAEVPEDVQLEILAYCKGQHLTVAQFIVLGADAYLKRVGRREGDRERKRADRDETPSLIVQD